MERRFRSERLRSLLSYKIPRCYGPGTLILPNRAVSPRILLLQHILLDAISFEDIAVKPDQSVLTALAETAYAFNPGNILFKSAPTHTIIIDFGEAYFREDDESDEEWDEILKGNWDVAVRQVLVRKGWASRKLCDRSTSNEQVFDNKRNDPYPSGQGHFLFEAYIREIESLFH